MADQTKLVDFRGGIIVNLLLINLILNLQSPALSRQGAQLIWPPI
jgi:hypothetical protein